MNFTSFLRRNKIILIAGATILLFTVWFWLLLPEQIFSSPYSTVIEAETGELLSAIIADDGQWRFPADKEVPQKFAACIIEFEDSRFLTHNGIDPAAIIRAMYYNIKRGGIYSGGSTITMQVIRLSRHGKARTFSEKFIEMMMALRMEMSYSKEEILRFYCAHAPFGSNVVGLEAASWRYYGSDPDMLTWGQAASLAVLPNAPSLIYPGKNDTLLIQKRNSLLLKLYNKGYFSEETYIASINEPLPGVPLPLPSDGFHLINRAIRDGHKGQRISTTIQKETQVFVQEIINKHTNMLSGNMVFNAGAIVIEVQTGNIIAYSGNSTISSTPNYQVDMISARRSPGSTLKPLLYCSMLYRGELVPDMLVPDIPMIADGFNPQNFNLTYDGAVKASNALSRSLNVPAVHMLKQHGIEKFHFFCEKAGITTFDQPPLYYGLSVILGGAEVRLDELSGVYASLARILIRWTDSKEYCQDDIFLPKYIHVDNEQQCTSISTNPQLADAASIWLMFQAMVLVNRPDQDMFWFHFSSTNPVAWKTGTSYGDRDAWAIGITPGYVVGVWAGNSSGEGRPGLTGVQAAAPIMFEIFDYLPKSAWFKEPADNMIQIKICSKSGYKAGPYCEESISKRVPQNAARLPVCPYHRLVHLDPTSQWQVHADCEDVSSMISRKWFILPPVMEYYYRQKNLFYKSLPPFREDCINTDGEQMIGIIYPVPGSKIVLTGEMNGEPGNVVFRAVHRKAGAKLYWHIDGEYIGMTQGKHTISVRPQPGKHHLVIVDEQGEMRECSFEISNPKSN